MFASHADHLSKSIGTMYANESGDVKDPSQDRFPISQNGLSDARNSERKLLKPLLVTEIVEFAEVENLSDQALTQTP